MAVKLQVTAKGKAEDTNKAKIEQTSGSKTSSSEPPKTTWVKRNKKWLIPVAILLVLALIAGIVFGVLKKRNGGGGTGDFGTEVVTVEEQDMSQSISVTGKVASQKTMTVTTDLTTQVKTLNVELGDHVKKGDVLCTFDVSEINDQIKTLEEQTSKADKQKALETSILKRNLNDAINDANANVQEADWAADNAWKNWNSVANNPDAEPEEVAEAEVAYRDAEKAVKAAVKEGNAAVQAAQDAIDQNELAADEDKESAKELAKLYHQRDSSTVRAGQDGIITQLNTSVGSVADGALMQIEDDRALTIKVSVKAKDIIKLEKGMTAEITTDAFPDETFRGTVVKVINFTSSGTIGADDGSSGSDDGFSANVNLDDAGGLLLGMSVKVKILIQDGGTAMAVPYDAVIDEDGTSYVYRVIPDGEEPDENGSQKGTVEKVRVNPGEPGDYYTGVASEDLNLGDYIISFPDSVSEGDTITFFVSDGMPFTEEEEE